MRTSAGGNDDKGDNDDDDDDDDDDKNNKDDNGDNDDNDDNDDNGDNRIPRAYAVEMALPLPTCRRKPSGLPGDNTNPSGLRKVDASNPFILRVFSECVDRINRKSQVAMTLKSTARITAF